MTIPAAGVELRIPLTLRRADGPVRATAAWLITGDDPAAWLAELTTIGVPLERVRLFIVPTSLHDRTPAGVLAVPGEAIEPVAKGWRAHPYGVVVGRLYLPVDAVPFPALSDAEVEAAVAWPVAMLHPSIGLVGFGAADERSVADLLEPPVRHRADWGRAEPGVPVNARLLSVQPDASPGIDEMLNESKDGIGTEPLEDVPHEPEESALKNAAGSVVDAIDGLRRKLLGLGKPRPSPGRGPLASIGQWLRRRGRRVTGAMERARQRELQRLLRLLREDPDLGLKFAPPLAGGAGRGVANPSDRLSSRAIDYDPARLLGGGAVDGWGVDADVRQRLLAEYRRAATRELGLGRYRRAAYIFANLLGDFAAAADALERGRFYREAAAIYRDKIQNLRAAAKCLESGGLLPEAIELYAQTRLYEHAGDLCMRIERPHDATLLYTHAVEQLLGAARRMEAARVLERKLRKTDESLAVLLAGWPQSPEAAECLREYFRLLATHGRHADATARVADLTRQPGSVDALKLLPPLVDVATSYPDDAVRHRTGDAARVLAGVHLRKADLADARAVTNLVMRLDPADRLLARDCQRYVERKTAALSSRRPRPAAPVNAGRAVLLRSFHLGRAGPWWGAASHGDSLLVLGRDRGGTVAAAARWADGNVHIDWTIARTSRAWPSRLEMVGADRPLLLAHFVEEPSAEPWLIGPGNGERVQVGLPRALIGVDVRAVAADEADAFWAVTRSNAAGGAAHALGSYRYPGGQVLSTRDVTLTDDKPVTIAVRRGRVLLASGDTLRVIEGPAGGRAEALTFSLPGEVRSMAVSPQWTTLRAAVMSDEGGAVVWPVEGRVVKFAEGLHDAIAGFTRTGELVAMNGREGRVYRCSTVSGGGTGTVTRIGAFEPARGAPPVAVVHAAGGREFGVVYADGFVQVFACPAE